MKKPHIVPLLLLACELLGACDKGPDQERVYREISIRPHHPAAESAATPPQNAKVGNLRNLKGVATRRTRVSALR